MSIYGLIGNDSDTKDTNNILNKDTKNNLLFVFNSPTKKGWSLQMKISTFDKLQINNNFKAIDTLQPKISSNISEMIYLPN